MMYRRCPYCMNKHPDITDVIVIWLDNQAVLSDQSCKEFCKEFGVNARSMRGILTRERNTSWGELMNTEREKRFSEVFGGLPLDIYHRVGFTSNLQFGRWFKRRYGIEYRKSRKQFNSFKEMKDHVDQPVS